MIERTLLQWKNLIADRQEFEKEEEEKPQGFNRGRAQKGIHGQYWIRQISQFNPIEYACAPKAHYASREVKGLETS